MEGRYYFICGLFLILSYEEARSTDYYEKGLKKFHFEIEYLDGSKEMIKTTLNIDLVTLRHFLFNSKGEEVYPEQTHQLTAYYRQRAIKAIPSDSLWLFKVASGTISCYASFPGVSYYDIEYIKKDGGQLQPFSKHDLKEMLSSDKHAYKTFKKGKRILTYGKVLATTGELILAVTLPNFIPVLTIPSTATIFGNFRFHKKAADKKLIAIEQYNTNNKYEVYEESYTLNLE